VSEQNLAKIRLKQAIFRKIQENFQLLSGSPEFYETNKIRLNQAKYIHLCQTHLVYNEIENVS